MNTTDYKAIEAACRTAANELSAHLSLCMGSMQPPPELAKAATLAYPYILAAAETARERDELRNESEARREIIRRITDHGLHLKRALENIEVTGPDDDGLRWIKFKSSSGRQGMVGFKLQEALIVQLAIEEWRIMRDAALKRGSPNDA